MFFQTSNFPLTCFPTRSSSIALVVGNWPFHIDNISLDPPHVRTHARAHTHALEARGLGKIF